jgi:hypothetical protein
MKWRLANWRVEMQLAELGLESWNKRAWVNVPAPDSLNRAYS